MLALFICFCPFLHLSKETSLSYCGINIYFVRNTHLLHRRNIICRTEDTWLSQNRRYILLKEAILYDYISFFLPKSRSNLKYLAVCQFKYFKYLVTYLTSENLAHSWKWKFLQSKKKDLKIKFWLWECEHRHILKGRSIFRRIHVKVQPTNWRQAQPFQRQLLTSSSTIK